MAMRLTFVISSLEAGGAERVASVIVRAWADRGRSVTLLTFDDGSKPPFYELHSAVDHRPLALRRMSGNPASAILNNLIRVWRLRQAIGDSAPDVVLSFGDTTNVLTLIAARGLGVPVVAAEHVDSRLHRIGLAWRLLRRLFYPGADAVTVLTERMGRQFPYVRRLTVIPNPVLKPRDGGGADSTLRRPAIVAAGRLHHQKDFSLLIRAFARIAGTFPDWSLYIFGEGHLRSELTALAHDIGVMERVFMPGLVADFDAILQQADVFALSSNYEGFPMSLCEAMANGVPVVATDCPTGPREILRPGIDGLLVECGDEVALADALSNLMANRATRISMGREARSIVDRFCIDRIFRMWDEVLHLAGDAAR